MPAADIEDLRTQRTPLRRLRAPSAYAHDRKGMGFAASRHMQTVVDQAPAGAPVPSVFDDSHRSSAPPATPSLRAVGWRRAVYGACLLAAPIAAGIAVGRATSRRGGILAGGLTALALGALRIELARWFTREPAFHREGRIGALELRRYPSYVEARAIVGESSFEAALDRGYHRLACFACGANETGALIERTMPVTAAISDGRYAIAFAMPPGRALDQLPRPTHPGVELREVPARRIAALAFRGRASRDNVAARERILLDQLLDAGLSARGSVAFAAFDSVATLPALRRNELWIEIV